MIDDNELSSTVPDHEDAPAGADTLVASRADDIDGSELATEDQDDGRSATRNFAILGAVAVLLLIAGVLYVLWAGGRVDEDILDREARAQASIEEFESSQGSLEDFAPPAEVALSSEADESSGVQVPQPGDVLFVNRTPGDDYGRLAIRHPDRTRTLLDRDCVRVHVAADRGVCLNAEDGIVAGFTTSFFDPQDPSSTLKTYASALPSRARISPDGTFSSVTAFVSGASYEDIGGEASTIVTIDEINGSGLTSMNVFDVVGTDEARYNNSLAQYWGMTFVDNDEFYVTGFYGDSPEIMRGSVEAQTVTPTGFAGSCPSLSPDGETLVFKVERDEGGFDLAAVDLESGRQWTLGETRSVDDQVEWLDDDTILYALHPEGSEDRSVQPEFDIWMIDIAEGSEPVLFLPNADSPAVVR